MAQLHKKTTPRPLSLLETEAVFGGEAGNGSGLYSTRENEGGTGGKKYRIFENEGGTGLY